MSKIYKYKFNKKNWATLKKKDLLVAVIYFAAAM